MTKRQETNYHGNAIKRVLPTQKYEKFDVLYQNLCWAIFHLIFQNATFYCLVTIISYNL